MRKATHSMLAVFISALSACGGELIGPERTLDTPTLGLLGAAASSQPISGTMTINGIVGIGSVRVSPGGVRHVTDAVTLLGITGDVTGDGMFLQSNSVNLKNGTGAARGPFDMQVSWNGRSGGITGTVAANVHGLVFGGTFVAHGNGGLEGLKFRFDFDGPAGGPFNYVGTVVSPANGS